MLDSETRNLTVQSFQPQSDTDCLAPAAPSVLIFLILQIAESTYRDETDRAFVTDRKEENLVLLRFLFST